MKREKVPETIVAAAVRDHLVDAGWDVYCEVQEYHASARADIVATLGPRVMVVEVKTAWSIRLIEQAEAWVPRAHLVYAAAPGPLPRQTMRSYLALAEHYQVGLMGAGHHPDGSGCTIHRRAPARSRPPFVGHLRSTLVDEQKTFAAPGSMGGYWSPYQQTVRELVRWVRDHPGRPMREAINAINHHYASPASAFSALAKWIRLGKIPGIEDRIDGRKLCLYPAEKET